jgi:hypothetical protein
MKTALHKYYLDTRNPAEAKAYKELEEKLKSTPGRGHWLNCIVTEKDRHDPPAGEITLEARNLFDNQWNSSVGRVFDWFEEQPLERHMKTIHRGHYLDITEEMINIRRNTLVCGYTRMQFPAGHQFNINGKPVSGFNLSERALGSEYLEEKELHLLRLKPVCEKFDRAPLTPDEFNLIHPLYVEAQLKTKQRDKIIQAGKSLSRVESEYQEAMRHATAERDGKLFLLKRDVNLDLVIYYPHTGTFSFGWHKPVCKAVADRLREILKDFPAEYEIIEEKK